MRGALKIPRIIRQGLRIIPAYAGSTLRISVDGVAAAGSSPRMRGAPPFILVFRYNVRIIPAYAGST